MYDDAPTPIDGMDVWNTISHGTPSPRKEILLNIDPIPSEDDNLGTTFYEGIALRMGDMKLLMNVPNSTWFKPPELGGEPDKEHNWLPTATKVKYLCATILDKSLIGHLTNSMKNWHCIDLPLPTPNPMLVSIHHTMGQYVIIVLGGKGGSEN